MCNDISARRCQPAGTLCFSVSHFVNLAWSSWTCSSRWAGRLARLPCALEPSAWSASIASKTLTAFAKFNWLNPLSLPMRSTNAFKTTIQRCHLQRMQGTPEARKQQATYQTWTQTMPCSCFSLEWDWGFCQLCKCWVLCWHTRVGTSRSIVTEMICNHARYKNIFHWFHKFNKQKHDWLMWCRTFDFRCEINLFRNKHPGIKVSVEMMGTELLDMHFVRLLLYHLML